MIQSNKGHAENPQQEDDLAETAEPGKILFGIRSDEPYDKPHHGNKYEQEQKSTRP